MKEKKKMHLNSRHETFLSGEEISLLVDADIHGWSPVKISSGYPTVSVNRDHQRKASDFFSVMYLPVETKCSVWAGEISDTRSVH